MRIPRVVLLVALLAGCVWGPRVSKLAPAQGPRGDSVTVTMEGGLRRFRGELYAVDSIDIYLTAPGLGRIPWSRIYSVRAEGAHRTYYTRDRRLASEKITDLAILSRFPQGLDSLQLAAVLAARRQPELQRLE